MAYRGANKTIIPELTMQNFAYSVDFLRKYSTYLSYVDSFLKEVEIAINYRITSVKNDVIKEKQKFFDELTEKFKEFNDEFCVYWLEVFNSNPSFFKSDKSVNFFRQISDSMGMITNSRGLFDDNTVSVHEIFHSQLRPITYIPNNAYQKISPWTLKTIEKASFRCNTIYRNNAAMLQEKSAKNTTAHGENLVPDTEHIGRMQKINQNLVQTLTTYVKDKIKIVQFFCNINDLDGFNYGNYDANVAKINFLNFKLDVEKVQYDVDILTNRIKKIKSRIVNDSALSVPGHNPSTQANRASSSTSQIDRAFQQNILTQLETINTTSLFKNISKQENIVSQSAASGSYYVEARITAYSRNEPGSDYYTQRGLGSMSNTYGTLQQGKSVAVDPKVIDYGSKISIPGLGSNFVAMDTGSAVVNRTASARTGGQPVIDVYFNTYEEQQAFVRSYPSVTRVLVTPASSDLGKATSASKSKNVVGFSAQKSVNANGYNAKTVEYPENAKNPTYLRPEWGAAIANCLGLNQIQNRFNNIKDPYDTSFNNLTDPNYDAWGAMDKSNPFSSITGVFGSIAFNLANTLLLGNITDLNFSTLSKLPDTIKNININNIFNQIKQFDLSQLSQAFGMNLPLPPLTIDFLFNIPNNIPSSLSQVGDTLLGVFFDAVGSMLNSICPGGGGGGSFSFPSPQEFVTSVPFKFLGGP